MIKNQIKRIETMESCLDESLEAIRTLTEAMDRYEKAEGSYYMLESYYGSNKWREDYEADEAGNIPQDLKRSVLSEDSVYDLITSHRDLMIRLQRAALKSMEAKEL